MLKMFDNCKRMLLEKGDKQVRGMESSEGETYDFITP